MTGHPIEVAELELAMQTLGVPVSVDDPGDLVVGFSSSAGGDQPPSVPQTVRVQRETSLLHGQPFQSEGLFTQIGELHNRTAKLQQPSGILLQAVILAGTHTK